MISEGRTRTKLVEGDFSGSKRKGGRSCSKVQRRRRAWLEKAHGNWVTKDGRIKGRGASRSASGDWAIRTEWIRDEEIPEVGRIRNDKGAKGKGTEGLRKELLYGAKAQGIQGTSAACLPALIVADQRGRHADHNFLSKSDRSYKNNPTANPPLNNFGPKYEGKGRRWRNRTTGKKGSDVLGRALSRLLQGICKGRDHILVGIILAATAGSILLYGGVYKVYIPYNPEDGKHLPHTPLLAESESNEAAAPDWRPEIGPMSGKAAQRDPRGMEERRADIAEIPADPVDLLGTPKEKEQELFEE